MKIQVTFELDEDDEYADPDHELGLTSKGYEYILAKIPGYDIEVERIDD